jgi:hypothetical protein
MEVGMAKGTYSKIDPTTTSTGESMRDIVWYTKSATRSTSTAVEEHVKE